MVERLGPGGEGRSVVMLAPPQEPPTRNVLPFIRKRPPGWPPPDTVMSSWARHIILCVDDAFPVGTVRSLEAAAPQDCFAIVDAALDVGQGSRYLWARPIREYLESEFFLPIDRDYEVIKFYLAPTHIHLLIREAEGFSLEAKVEYWKAMAVRGLSDPRDLDPRIWAPGYYDTVLMGPREIEAERMAIDLHRPRAPGEREGR
jgi:hypothetical protein